MTPTDVQIEAAAKAMHAAGPISGQRLTLGNYRALARVALTAALQHDTSEHTEPVGMVTPAAEL